jgi:hypothetical protein
MPAIGKYIKVFACSCKKNIVIFLTLALMISQMPIFCATIALAQDIPPISATAQPKETNRTESSYSLARQLNKPEKQTIIENPVSHFQKKGAAKEEPRNQASNSHEPTPLFILLAGLILVFALTALAAMRNKPWDQKLSSLSDAPTESDLSQAHVTPGGQKKISLPRAIFPGEWFASANQEELSKWLSSTKDNALNAFSAIIGEGKGPIAPDTFGAAQNKLWQTTREALASEALLGILCGGKELGPAETAILASHGRSLFPPLKLSPPPPPSGEPKILAIAAAGALGAMLGYILGGWLFKFRDGASETGTYFGSMAGAALAVAASLFLAQNDKFRKRLILAVGGLSLMDALSNIFLTGLGPLKPGGNSIWSFLKRQMRYAAIILVLAFIKGKAAFDRDRCLEEAGTALDNYLSLALSVLSVLMYPPKEIESPAPQEDKLLLELVPLAQKLLSRPGAQDDFLVSEIGQRLENAGFLAQPPAKAGQAFIWDEETMKELYDTFGYIESGRQVIAEEETVMRDGKVVKKGLVVKAR